MRLTTSLLQCCICGLQLKTTPYLEALAENEDAPIAFETSSLCKYIGFERIGYFYPFKYTLYFRPSDQSVAQTPEDDLSHIIPLSHDLSPHFHLCTMPI